MLMTGYLLEVLALITLAFQSISSIIHIKDWVTQALGTFLINQRYNHVSLYVLYSICTVQYMYLYVDLFVIFTILFIFVLCDLFFQIE